MREQKEYTRRPRAHRFRLRVRWGLRPEKWLLAAAGVLLAVSALVMIRSAVTRSNNERYAEWHEQARRDTAAETVAPRPAATPAPQLARMGMPDGSAIPAETRKAPGGTARDITVSTAYRKTAGEILPQMAALREHNRDLCGWLTISGLLDLPVVYRDNTFYMDHDFEGRFNDAGTLFLDEANPVTETAQNLLIYGHNMRDGSMFGLLTHYQQEDYIGKHPFITFSTLWEEDEYVIFAVVKVSMDPQSDRFVSFFAHPSFAEDRQFEEYIARLRELSCRKTFVSVKPEDALLTLCTCLGEDRLLVAARRIRSGESKTYLKSLLR